MKALSPLACLIISTSILTPSTPQTSPQEERAKREELSAFYYNRGMKEYNKGNHAKAFQLFSKVAELGDPAVQYQIGLMYDIGIGVRRNWKQAVKWYTKAVGQGHVRAQYNLALLYNNDEFDCQNYKQAVILFRKATQQGDKRAQAQLALAYWEGQGVPRDNVTAYAWANIQGVNSSSNKLRIAFEAKMTTEQIAKGQELSRRLSQANPRLLID